MFRLLKRNKEYKRIQKDKRFQTFKVFGYTCIVVDDVVGIGKTKIEAIKDLKKPVETKYKHVFWGDVPLCRLCGSIVYEFYGEELLKLEVCGDCCRNVKAVKRTYNGAYDHRI